MDFAGELDAVLAFLEQQEMEARRGRVDFMYVRDQAADRLFAATSALPGPGGRMIPAPRPEHLIAMKVQAAECNRLN